LKRVASFQHFVFFFIVVYQKWLSLFIAFSYRNAVFACSVHSQCPLFQDSDVVSSDKGVFEVPFSDFPTVRSYF
jgi:hypothetical protein